MLPCTTFEQSKLSHTRPGATPWFLLLKKKSQGASSGDVKTRPPVLINPKLTLPLAGLS